MTRNYINHIALVIDASSSMSCLSKTVVEVADNQVAYLAQRSKELDQETRISLYLFADEPKCLIYDKDVLRMPSLKGLYKAYGNTALRDATGRAIDDLAKTPELYGDHSFLVYVLTDGAENISARVSEQALTQKLTGLKDNWTVAIFVPNQMAKFEAKKAGFPNDNIAVWDTTAQGLESAGSVMRQATEQYMTSRAVGVRGTKNLFSMSVAAVDKTAVAKTLTKLHPGQYRLFAVEADGEAIAPFVERQLNRAYRSGEAYYQLSKPEKIQGTKAIVLFETKTKALFTGADARRLLSLPDHEVKVAPDSHPDFQIFVQSTSVNRKLVAGTKLLVLS